MSGECNDIQDIRQDDEILRLFYREIEDYAIFLLDPEGSVATWNPGAERLLGYAAAEVRGRDLSFFAPEGATRPTTETAPSYARSGTHEERTRWVRKDGSELWVRLRVRPLRRDDGERGFAAVVRDVTARRAIRRELERRQDRLARLEELGDVGGWELDPETDALRWTAGTKRLLGVPADHEPTFPDALELFHPDDRETVEDAIDAARETGEAFDLEARITTPAGRKRWVQMRGERIDGGTLRGVIRDVSTRREREQRLTVLNRVLRHNLRNNLNVVSGYAETVRDDLAALALPDGVEGDGERLKTALERLFEATDGLDAELSDLYQTVEALSEFSSEAAIRRTDRILENSADLVSIGEKARRFERAVREVDGSESTSVQSVFDALERRCDRTHPGARIEVGETDARVAANASAVALAVGELVENAVLHCEDERPRVTLAAERIERGRVRIVVEDDGPGIPAEEREVLREGEETPLTHGSGMGLWTVNWIVRQFDGEIAIDRADGRTAVSLTLPAADGAA
jgi:PAS domain S-box-containing protein